jgi:hypothetical protein
MSGPRMLVLFALVGLAGTAVAVLPALAAAPSEVKLEVAPNCNISGWPCWNPEGSPEGNVGFNEVAPFKLAQGGTISFEDKDSQAPTDVIWKGATRPSCTGVVEAPPTKTGWSGTCTFATAGEYEFESEGLFNDGTSNYTKYKVIVEGASTGTTPTTPSTTTPSTTTPTTTTPTTPTTPSETGSSSPLEGGSKALKLPGSQHGSAVHGSIKVSQAGAGGRLEVSLFATGAPLAKAGHSQRARVGQLVRSSLKSGSVSFSVPLSAKGKAALRRHRRLALTVKITLTPQHSAAVTLTRNMVLHA